MGEEWEQFHKKTWAPKQRFVVFSIQNAPVAKLVEDVRKLGIDLRKQDHIVIV
jgi:hypothetical protein